MRFKLLAIVVLAGFLAGAAAQPSPQVAEPDPIAVETHANICVDCAKDDFAAYQPCFKKPGGCPWCSAKCCPGLPKRDCCCIHNKHCDCKHEPPEPLPNPSAQPDDHHMHTISRDG